MTAADLHYALVMDDELYQASQIDPTLMDPVVRVEGPLPGLSRTVTVLRDYQGPQGFYTEQVVIRDRAGHAVGQSRLQRVHLSGEAFENRFITSLPGLDLHDGDEHEAAFLINGQEVGKIPVFVEGSLGGDLRIAAEATFDKALAKGAVIWLTVPTTPKRAARASAPHHQPVWYVLKGKSVYVFTGPSEQDVPGLTTATEVFVTARSKDLRSQVSRVPAAVRIIPGDDPLFDEIGQAGMGRRLNLPDGEGALERWRRQCVLVELTPAFRETASGAA